MVNNSQTGTVLEFYDAHPINEQQILDKLRDDGVDLENVTEDILQRYDQDHYGGVAANDALATLANIDKDCHVLDVCCGMGGPSRYLAHNYGCRVTGIDLTNSRIEGAKNLTKMAGLDDLVMFKNANALDLQFADETFDALISHDAEGNMCGLCHFPQDNNKLLVDLSDCISVGLCAGQVHYFGQVEEDLPQVFFHKGAKVFTPFCDALEQ